MTLRAALITATTMSLCALLAGCAGAPEPDEPPVRPAARVFVPPVFEAIDPENDTPRHVEEGLASWYGPGFHGNLTASGEVFDQAALSAAHRSLPLPSLARVTRLDTGDSVLVRINDRGPFVDDRVIDLSHAAAEALGFIEDGVAQVRVEALGPADGEDRAAAPVFFDPEDGPPAGS
ncbi:MAG: septal ring lytic transglycosylase RlpA family protein [Oceanicaulis sp.]